MNNPTLVANAFNNWYASIGGKEVAFPRATIEASTDLLKRAGLDVIVVEDVPVNTLRDAMLWFRDNTDWSAFSRADFAAAYAAL